LLPVAHEVLLFAAAVAVAVPVYYGSHIIIRKWHFVTQLSRGLTHTHWSTIPFNCLPFSLKVKHFQHFACQHDMNSTFHATVFGRRSAEDIIY